MLAEKRQKIILQMIAEKGSATIVEIKERLGISESTIRRDLTALAEMGALEKVFGGAVAVEGPYTAAEPSVSQKIGIHREEKQRIAAYAARMIEPDDFVYLDAGTTTGYMIDYITERQATFVTNAVFHAKRLAVSGFRVILLGGELKGTTEAVVGSQALLSIRDFHFTKGFFGTNGVSIKYGYTTPDSSEALVKRSAMEHSAKNYILADWEKFGAVSAVTFGDYDTAQILTEGTPPEAFAECGNIIVAEVSQDRTGGFR